MGKFLSVKADCSWGNDVIGRLANGSGALWSVCLLVEAANEVGTSGGGTCDIGGGIGELLVIFSTFLIVCDVEDGIKDGGGQWGGRCWITGGVLEWRGSRGEVTLKGGDKKWDLGGVGDLAGVSGFTSTSETGGNGFVTSVSTEWGVLGGDEELRSSCKEQRDHADTVIVMYIY